MRNHTVLIPYLPVPNSRKPEAAVVHQEATPLVEVFSVWIDNDGCIAPRKIFGRIEVDDGFGDRYTLYDRNYEESESLGGPNGSTLTLCDPHRSGAEGDRFMGMSPSGPVDVSVELRDISHGEIVLGTLRTNYDSLDCYDRPCVESFGFATVYWATLRAAVLATVRVSYEGEGDQRVYGSLYAYYGSDYGRFCARDEEKYFRVALFDRPRHEPAPMGPMLGLTRSVLAVPAHSSIVIEGCLWDADGHSELVVEARFGAQTYGYNQMVLKNRIRVEVKFKPGETFFQDDLAGTSNE